MKKRLLSLLLTSAFALSLSAQNLPVRTVTIFKNGRALLEKTGQVPLQDGRYSVTNLPDALFGTFWVSATDGSLQSVFAVQDTVNVTRTDLNFSEILLQNLGKPIQLHLVSGNQTGYEPVNGVVEKVYKSESGNSPLVLFRTTNGRWLTFSAGDIRRFEFTAEPNLSPISRKKAAQRLELRFKPNQKEAQLGLSYLTEGLGWTPVYRLELSGKNRGRLALRAEIVNDAEDLGQAELRLAVGMPNFAYATSRSFLFDFNREVERFQRSNALNPYRGNNFSNAPSSYQVALGPDTYEDREASADGGDFAGSQAEDFYFYTVRPGDFPNHSRYQLPIFEADVVPTHFYECVLPSATPGTFAAYRDARAVAEARHPVFHYIEFKNPTAFPWTTGAVNLLSQNDAGLQPVSQDMLPYTAAGATCKVKIAQTPEIKITHAEGDVDRQENAKKFFSTTYDKVRIEAQCSVINYRNEPVTLKIRRTLEGQPLSSEQKWVTQQEQATLRVNPSNTLEWILELKAGEERKWSYSYEVFVNM